jgi:hypothetical protein
MVGLSGFSFVLFRPVDAAIIDSQTGFSDVWHPICGVWITYKYESYLRGLIEYFVRNVIQSLYNV